MMLIVLPFVLTSPFDKVAAANAAAFRSALLRRDAAWFDRTFAPGFTQKVEGNVLDRRAALAQLKGGLMRMDVTGLSAKVTKVRPDGKGYVAQVSWTGTMKAMLQNQPAKLTAKWTDEQRWLPANGRWSLHSIVTSNFERTVD